MSDLHERMCIQLRGAGLAHIANEIECLKAENETLKREARSNHASAKKRAEWSKKHRAEIKRLQATCLDAARKLCEATEKRPTNWKPR